MLALLLQHGSCSISPRLHASAGLGYGQACQHRTSAVGSVCSGASSKMDARPRPSSAPGMHCAGVTRQHLAGTEACGCMSASASASVNVCVVPQ